MNLDLAIELQENLVAAGGAPWFDDLWGSPKGFVENGFGFVAVGSEGIACNCRACWVKDAVVPLQVSTRIYARGRGLATVVCRAFIEHCLANEWMPEYSCVSDNYASIALAAKLGFVPHDPGSDAI